MEVSGEITALPQVTGNFLTYPGWDLNPDSGGRQLAVSGKALDHTAIRAGPAPSEWFRFKMSLYINLYPSAILNYGLRN